MIFDLQPIVSWPFFFVILLLLTAVSATSLFFQWRRGDAGKRIVLRIVLFFVFAFSLSMAVLRPQKTIDADSSGILVYGTGLSKQEIDYWKDSLQVRRAVTISNFTGSSDRVILLGDRFSPNELYPLRNIDFQWIAPERDGAARELAWKGYLRKGEIQRLSFEIFSDKKGAALEVPGLSTEKYLLDKGWNRGLLEFYPRGLGRAEFPLTIDQDTLTTIRFFIGPSSPKKYHLQLGFPGAESRVLSNWLREKGETVTEQIQLSRETVLQSGVSTDSLEILLIDPAQLEQRSIQDRVKKEKAALIVFNVGQASGTAQVLNRVFGTNFQLEQSSPNDSRLLSNGIEALPFSFVEKSGQKLLWDRAVAIQYYEGRPIVMSLVNASYPLVLEGKGDSYEKAWGELLSELEPEESAAWRFEAPALVDFAKEVQLVDKSGFSEKLTWGIDTVYLKKDPINPFLAKADVWFKDTAWVDIDSAFSVYSYPETQLVSLRTSALIDCVKKINNQSFIVRKYLLKALSPWIWIAGMLLSSGLIWLEPKLNF